MGPVLQMITKRRGVSLKGCFPLGFNFGGEGKVLKSSVLRIWEVVFRQHSRKQELRASLGRAKPASWVGRGVVVQKKRLEDWRILPTY